MSWLIAKINKNLGGLEILDVSDNMFSAKSGLALTTAVRNLASLQELYCQGNSLNDEAA